MSRRKSPYATAPSTAAAASSVTTAVTATRENPTTRFLRYAQLCRARDLKQIFILGGLVKSISELIHALQKERGASSIFLGSNGAQFEGLLATHVEECRKLELLVRQLLDHVDAQLDRMSAGARFYTRVALAFRALDSLPGIRQQISTLILAPQDAVKMFTEIIACLLAVGFEAADIAADPETSRALVALVNFAQGKEYAGQERATAGAAFSRGEFAAADRRHLKHLELAQSRAFQIFTEFADPAFVSDFCDLANNTDAADLNRMRDRAADPASAESDPAAAADAWYQVSTRRIDAMKLIEDRLATHLEKLCASKLEEAETGSAEPDQAAGAVMGDGTPVAMVVTDVDPATNNLGIDGGIGMYPMRSILDVVKAQSRRIDDMNMQLESARVALAERKAIERAKGILMRSRRLSEEDAYGLMRQTAMKQNKRIIEVAEAILSMADILRTTPSPEKS